MKKYLVAGLLLSSLLVGCGQENASTKKDTPKSEQEVKKDAQADKKVDETKHDELKDTEKLDDNVPRITKTKRLIRKIEKIKLILCSISFHQMKVVLRCLSITLKHLNMVCHMKK